MYTKHFFGTGSAASNGHHGCQIWLHRTRPLTVAGLEVKWSVQSLSILHSTARALLITVCAGKQRFALLTAHGPTAATPADELEEWWRELAAIMRKVPQKCILLAGLDANARSSADVEAPCEEAAEGLAAVQLCRFANHHLLSCTNLVDVQGRKVVTWTSPNGKDACIDYLLVPKEMGQGLLTLGAVDGFEDLHDRDHTPLWAELAWSSQAQVSKSIFRVDTAAMDTVQGRAILKKVLADVPPIPWECSVDAHLLQMTDHIRRALCEHFPKVTRAPRRSYFSQDTWEMVSCRRLDKRIGRRGALLRNKHVLHLLFKAWRLQSCQLEATLDTKGRMSAADLRAVDRRIASLDMLAAASQKRVIDRSKCLRVLTKRDVAAEAKKRFHEARHAGPEPSYAQRVEDGSTI